MAWLDDILGPNNTLFGLTGDPASMQTDAQTDALLKRLQQAAGQNPADASPVYGGMGMVLQPPTAEADQAITQANARRPDTNVGPDTQTMGAPPAAAEMPRTLAPSIESKFPDQPVTPMTMTTASLAVPSTAPPAGPRTTPGPQPQVSSAPPMRRAGPIPVPGPAAFAGGSAPVTPAQSADFSPSFGERMQHFGNALTGRETGSLSEIQRQRQATYDALTGAGVDPALAKAAALNPEVMKKVLDSTMGPSKWTVVGVDNYGNPRYGFVKETTESVKIPNVNGGTGQDNGALQRPMDENGNPRTGLDFLEHVQAPAMYVDKAMNILRGDEAMPRPTRGDKTAMPVGELVRAAEKKYSSNWFNYQSKWRDANAMVGRTRIANNTAILHVSQLSNLVEDAPDANVGPFNNLSTSVQKWWMNKNNSPWLNDWNTIAQTLAGEIVKVNTGAEGSITDREKVMAVLDPSRGKEALQGAIRNYIGLLAGKTTSLAHDWKKNASPYSDVPEVIDPENQNILKTLVSQYRITPHDIKQAKGDVLAWDEKGDSKQAGSTPAAPDTVTAPAPALATPEQLRGVPKQPPANAKRGKDGRLYLPSPSDPNAWIPWLEE